VVETVEIARRDGVLGFCAHEGVIDVSDAVTKFVGSNEVRDLVGLHHGTDVVIGGDPEFSGVWILFEACLDCLDEVPFD
jgi:hypothetical protein